MINDLTIITININYSRLTINNVVNFVVGVRLTSINPRVFAVRTRRCIFLFVDFLLISCKQNVNFKVKVAKGVNYFSFGLIIIFEK